MTGLCLFLIMKMMKMKAEARLDLLRQVGVAVETWLKSAMNQVMEELENECWNNLSSHDASLSVRATETLPFKASAGLSDVLCLRVDVCYWCCQRDRFRSSPYWPVHAAPDWPARDWVVSPVRAGLVVVPGRSRAASRPCPVSILCFCS